MITRRRLAQKWRHMPDRQTIQYLVRQVPGTGWNAPVTVENAERRHPSRKDRESTNAQIRSAELIWFVWRDQMANIFPKEGDQIVFGDERWSVVMAIEELLGQRIRLFCTKGFA